jgi:hypothetical protein
MPYSHHVVEAAIVEGGAEPIPNTYKDEDEILGITAIDWNAWLKSR